MGNNNGEENPVRARGRESYAIGVAVDSGTALQSED